MTLRCLALLVLLALSSCTFPRAVRKLQQNKTNEAIALLQKAVDHPTYGPGARYYLNAITINRERDTETWLAASDTLCLLEAEVQQLSRKQLVKLKKHRAATGDIRQTRENLQTRITDQMQEQGRMAHAKS